MPDPLIVAAVGAVVGGTAGKVVGLAWDSCERWLRERFGTHSHKVQEHARANAGEFIEELAKRLREQPTQERPDGPSSASVADSVEEHPGFSALIQRCLVNASETNEHVKHCLLADLVAMRVK